MQVGVCVCNEVYPCASILVLYDLNSKTRDSILLVAIYILQLKIIANNFKVKDGQIWNRANLKSVILNTDIA